MILFEDNVNIITSNEIDNGLICTILKRKDMKNSYCTRCYLYNNMEEYKHPKLSWQNLSYICDGLEEETVLPLLVLEGKKLVANVVSDKEIEYEKMPEVASDKIIFFKEKTSHGNINSYYFCAKGKLRDYFDLNEVLNAYNNHTDFFKYIEEYDLDQEGEINGFDKYYYESLKNAFNYDIADLIKGELTGYNWASPDDDWQLTLTGLLLGIPIESTASILNGN